MWRTSRSGSVHFATTGLTALVHAVEMPVAGFAEQVELAFDNLGVALRSAGLDYADVFQLRTYVVDHTPDKLAVVGAAIARRWPGRPPVQTLLGVAGLALPDMRFEVDAIAVRR